MKFIKIGETLFNLEHIASAQWEDERLFVHTSGGRWRELTGKDAESLWTALQQYLAAVEQPKE